MMADWYPSYDLYGQSSFSQLLFNVRSPRIFGATALLLAFSLALIVARTGVRQRNGWRLFQTPLDRSVFLAGLSVAAFVFCSPLVHAHYALLLLPLFAILARPSATGASYFSVMRCLTLASFTMLAVHPLLLNLGLTHRDFDTLFSYIGVAIPAVLAILRLLDLSPDAQLEYV